MEEDNRIKFPENNQEDARRSQGGVSGTTTSDGARRSGDPGVAEERATQDNTVGPGGQAGAAERARVLED